MEHVVSIKYLGGHRLRLRFGDGVEGVVDFAKLLKFRGELDRPLRDPKYFARAFLDREGGFVAWPNGMDVCNTVLYSKVSGRSVRSLLKPGSRPEHRAKARPRAAAR
jgi:hypothetical protein